MRFKQCPACGHQAPWTLERCPECGADLAKYLFTTDPRVASWLFGILALAAIGAAVVWLYF